MMVQLLYRADREKQPHLDEHINPKLIHCIIQEVVEQSR